MNECLRACWIDARYAKPRAARSERLCDAITRVKHRVEIEDEVSLESGSFRAPLLTKHSMFRRNTQQKRFTYSSRNQTTECSHRDKQLFNYLVLISDHSKSIVACIVQEHTRLYNTFTKMEEKEPEDLWLFGYGLVDAAFKLRHF